MSTRLRPWLAGGRLRLRVHRLETRSSADLEVFNFWLFCAAQAFTLASSAGIEEEFKAGMTIVTSSAYFMAELPEVHFFRSDELMMYIGGPRADP